MPSDLGTVGLTLPYGRVPQDESPPEVGSGLPWATKPIGIAPFDHGLYALMALGEFIRAFDSQQLERLIEEAIPLSTLSWQTDPAAGAVSPVPKELAALRKLMLEDRAEFLAEILAQHDGALDYWIALLGLDRARRPWTRRLLSLAAHIGEFVVVHAKAKYNRPRPSELFPGLMPPFGPPAHPAFPSGHATQSWFIASCLNAATTKSPSADGSNTDGPYKGQLEWLAARMTKNRERGGFHYESDSKAGEALGKKCFMKLNELWIETANKEAPPGLDNRKNKRIAEILDNAHAEWWPKS